MRKTLLAASAIITIAILIVVAVIFLRIYRFPFVSYTILGATYSLTHWFSWLGTIYIFFASPIQPIIKRKAPAHYRKMLTIHMIGNLLAVLFISIHFAQQLTRPATNFPDLGTGIILYVAMVFLVATGLTRYSGIMRRFMRQINLLHVSFALTFYTAIVVHILQGISII